MVHRLADFDIPARLSGAVPASLVKLGCVVLGTGLAVFLRIAINLVAPGIAPFSLVYPSALLATLLGGWEAGLGTLVLTEVLAWGYVVPLLGAPEAYTRAPIAASVIVTLCGLAVIAAGAGFRLAARRIHAERDAKLAQRELLLRELQHRVTNDFAIASSMLEMQRRRSTDPETRLALIQAAARVRSIGRTHHHLYALPQTLSVDLKQYLQDLCAALSDAALAPAGIEMECECDAAIMERDRAQAIGFITNELVINALKHAFPDGRTGQVRVRFARHGEGWRLCVSDNGAGFPAAPASKPGLGAALIAEFVKKTDGTLSYQQSAGTTATVDLPQFAAVPDDDTLRVA